MPRGTPTSGLGIRRRPACSASNQEIKSGRGESGPGRAATRQASMSRAPQLVREACHDMRQPVAGVLRLAAAALAQPGVPDATRDYLEQIITQTVSLTELIHQSLYADEPDRVAAVRTDLRQLTAEACAAERVTYEGTVEFLSLAEPVL